MMISAKEGSVSKKLTTSHDKWPEEFPDVQLLPNLKGSLDARSWLSADDGDEDWDEDRTHEKRDLGHVHSFDYDFKNGDHGWVHVWVSDLDGPPLKQAAIAFQKIVSELNEMIEQLINLPAGNYPYPPKGWDDEAIAKNMAAWHECSTGHSVDRRKICEGVKTSKEIKSYAVDESGKPIDDTRGHIHEVCLTIPELDMTYHRVAFDDRNGSIEDQTADYLRGMIQTLESKLAEVEAAEHV